MSLVVRPSVWHAICNAFILQARRGNSYIRWPNGTLPIYSDHSDAVPVNREIWEAHPFWNPAREGWQFDTDLHVVEKRPTWDELIAPFAEQERKEILRWWIPNSLDKKYQQILSQHVAGVRHKVDLVYYQDRLGHAGREDEISATDEWAKHLYQRYHEIRFALENGNDETIIGFYQCYKEDHNDWPWLIDRIWTEPRWKPEPSLPYFDKHNNVLRTRAIKHGKKPPSGVFVERLDRTTLQVLSVSPATVSMSVQPNGGFYEMAFKYPSNRTINVDQTAEGVEQLARITFEAYGETHNKNMVIERIDDQD